MSGITCEMKCAECARVMCTGARKLAEEARAGSGSAPDAETGKAGHMKDPCDPATPPVVGSMCIVLTEDTEVPLRTAYWCSGVWRDPHTARPLVPGVKRYCLMAEAVAVLCGAEGVGR
jgi:hypothetical protein